MHKSKKLVRVVFPKYFLVLEVAILALKENVTMSAEMINKRDLFDL